ncbi:hypothetical protein [Parasphingorhabdus sp.]|uniref:hypothetical protein n=1 Tax=Parasphingorhabdus sp. TaxID=2709688 RepID=UPI002F938730
MTNRRLSVLATILLLANSWNNSAWAAQSDVAADQSTVPQSKYHDLDDKALYEMYVNESFTNSCEAKSLLSEMLKREVFSDGALLDYTENSINCAIQNGDMEEAYRNIVKWEGMEGAYELDAGWAFRVAYVAGARDDALGRLEKIAQFEEPDELLESTGRFIFQVIGDLHQENMKDAVTRLHNILIESPHFEILHPDVRSSTAAHILGERIKSGNRDAAGEFLAHITTPDFYTEMLSSREYEPIWNEIEQRVGPNMEIVIGEYLQIISAAYQSDPQNKKIRQDYAHALNFAGQFEDIITLAQSVDHSPEAIPNWGEDDGWLLNIEAYAHDALGNTAAADRIFDSFVALDDPSNQKGWRVNFLINRASRFVRQTRWEEALAAAKIAGDVAAEAGNPYARMLVRLVNACALHNLGRVEESLAVIKEVEAHQEDSLRVSLDALLCVGERERAAEMMVKGLADEKDGPILIETLQNPQFDTFYTSTRIPTIYSELRSHPKVTEAFERVGRTIPDSYIPLAGQRLHQLAAERQAD